MKIDNHYNAIYHMMVTVLNNMELSTIYPIGVIYTSMSNVSPASIFGGMWEQLTDCLIRAADAAHPAGPSGVDNYTDARSNAIAYPLFGYQSELI